MGSNVTIQIPIGILSEKKPKMKCMAKLSILLSSGIIYNHIHNHLSISMNSN